MADPKWKYLICPTDLYDLMNPLRQIRRVWSQRTSECDNRHWGMGSYKGYRRCGWIPWRFDKRRIFGTSKNCCRFRRDWYLFVQNVLQKGKIKEKSKETHASCPQQTFQKFPKARAHLYLFCMPFVSSKARIQIQTWIEPPHESCPWRKCANVSSLW